MTDHSTDLPDLPPPQSRRSAETWAAARADYLAGGSAAEVCERHSLPLSTFRWRAQQEGWRRMDQPVAAAPFHVTDDLGDYRNWTPAPAPMDEADAADADPSANAQAAPADAAPFVSSHEDAYEDDLPAAADLCEQAWFNAARAIRHGRMIEARGWTRLHKELAAIAHDRDGDRMRRLNEKIGRNLADLKASIGAMRAAPKDL